MFSDDRPDPDRLLGRLRSMRDLEGIPAFAATLHYLAHVDVSDKAAERLLSRILDHRGAMVRALGRDPGLRVALADYLSNVEPRLSNPMIVESSRFERTARSAITDSLTGLYNRRFFASALALELRRSRRYGLSLSLVMMDLDGFKAFNDRHGHPAGDVLLRRVGRLARRAIRESDLACRYGGEEFAMILPETDRLGAFIVAERIRVGVESAAGDTESPALTVSGGIACFPEDAEEPDALVARADEALYRAKALGKNRIALHYSERRASVRFPARPSAHVRLTPDSESEGSPVVALDMSRDGALVETSSPYRPADPVRVVLGHASRVSKPPEAWVVPGRVVRVSEAGPGAYQVGIRFDERLPEPLLRAQTRPCGPAPRAT